MNDRTRGRSPTCRRVFECQFIPMVIALLLWLVPPNAAASKAPSDSTAASAVGYRIDEPGTITFTVGVKISGKVEKPQVMIFLPKEKTLYREEVFTRSFREELMQPLPFTPQTE